MPTKEDTKEAIDLDTPNSPTFANETTKTISGVRDDENQEQMVRLSKNHDGLENDSVISTNLIEIIQSKQSGGEGGEMLSKAQGETNKEKEVEIIANGGSFMSESTMEIIRVNEEIGNSINGQYANGIDQIENCNSGDFGHERKADETNQAELEQITEISDQNVGKIDKEIDEFEGKIATKDSSNDGIMLDEESCIKKKESDFTQNAILSKNEGPAVTPEKPFQMGHQVKWIHWSGNKAGTKIPIVTQNENGPCPLLALANVLFLRGQARLVHDVGSVSSQFLLDILRDCIIRLTPQEMTSHRADYQRNVEDALESLSKLVTGIDVNVRFSGVDQFEYTPDCLIFDLLNIPLYHGWLIEPEHGPLAEAVGKFTYNQLVEYIIEGKNGRDEERAILATLAEEFLVATASQLTYRGLCDLNATLKDGELCVFFRNNHFSTLMKHGDELFSLVTDQGFLNESRVIWESLNSVDGDSRFVDMEFVTVPPKSTAVVPSVEHAAPLAADASPQEQIDHDLMVALSLEEQERINSGDGGRIAISSEAGLSREEYDRQLAIKLQEEEDRLAVEHQQASAATSSQGDHRNATDSAASGVQKPVKKDKDKCCIV